MAARKAAANINPFAAVNNNVKAYSMYDHLAAAIGGLNKAVEEVTSVDPKPLPKIAKTEFGKVGEDMFVHLRLSRQFADGEKGSRKMAGIEADSARVRFATLCENIPAKDRLIDPAAEQEMKKLIEEMDKIRYATFVAAYPEGSLPEKFVHVGKEQSTKHSDGRYKFGSMNETKYEWNVLSKFVSAIKKHGWEAVCPKGQYIGDANVQKIGKVPATPGTGGSGGNDPVGAARAALHTLKVRLEKIDKTSGDLVPLLNEITMAAATLMMAAQAATKKAKEDATSK